MQIPLNTFLSIDEVICVFSSLKHIKYFVFPYYIARLGVKMTSSKFVLKLYAVLSSSVL